MTDVAGRSFWRSIPGRVPDGPSLARPVAAWALAAAPTAVQLARQQYPLGSILRALSVALVAVLLARALPRLTPLIGAAAVVAILLWDPAFPGPPVVLLVGLTLSWGVVCGAIRPRLARWPSDRALRFAVPALVGVSAVLLFLMGVRVPLMLLGAAVVGIATAVLWPDPLDQWLAASDPLFDRGGTLLRINRSIVDRVGRVLGGLLAALAMMPAVAIALVTWVGHRMLRYDPLAPPVEGGSRWVRRHGDDLDPRRAYATARVHDDRRRVRALHRLAATVPSLAILAGLVMFVAPGAAEKALEETGSAIGRLSDAIGLSNGPAEDATVFSAEACDWPPDPAMDADPGWPLVGCETTEFALRARFDPVTTYKFEDYDGRWVNVREGVRRTWKPPPCDCQRVRVWWFGGSAAWGYFQRDDFALASQFAKAAWEEGVAVDVTNFAMPGWVIGQEARQFAQLTTTESPPDMVIFYDGANDLILQRDRNDHGRGDDESEISFAEQELDLVLRDGPFEWSQRAADRVADEEAVPLGMREVARHGMARYARGVRLATRFADAVGVDPVFVWQPILPTGPSAIGSPDSMSPRDREQWAIIAPTARAALPDGVIDLADALDSVDRVVFKDYVHHNEHAADVVARALEERLRPQLERLAQTARPPGP